jgi:deoxyribonuclease-4
MKIGAHVSTAGGIQTGIGRGEEIACDAIQIFTQSPRMWRPTNYTDSALDGYAEVEAASSIDATYCHATYLINLATFNDDLAVKSYECLVNNLIVATRIASKGVVLHVGSHRGGGFDAVVDQIAATFRKALDEVEEILGRSSCRLLLENAAGTGGTVGRSFEEIAKLIEKAGGDERLGVCVDTQHLFASGVSYATQAEADAVIRSFDDQIGLSRLGCFHLNDSKVPLGSNRDRHENLGDGEIGTIALGWLLSHPALDDVPALLEVPGTGDGPRASDVFDARELLADALRARGRAVPAELLVERPPAEVHQPAAAKPKGSPAKKTAAKKTVAKKSATNKVPAKKVAAKKAATRTA